MIYAYAICESDDAASADTSRGLGGARVRALKREGLAALYTRHYRLRVGPDPGLVLVHERVVESAMTRGAVLPLRFGTQLEGEDALAAVLLERRDQLHEALNRVRGRVELGLRVIPVHDEDPTHPAGTSGRDYLLKRVAKHRAGESVARDVHVPLATLAEASVVRRPRAPAILVCAYLVAEGRVSEFRNRAQTLATRRPDLRALVTGPWPPYSFVAEGPG